MTASPVQLTGGNFQDSEGNPLVNGYLKMKLSQDGTIMGVGAICSGVEITIQLDANGSVVTSPAQSVWGNDIIVPANTYYTVTGYTAAGQPAWGPNVQQVVGGPTFDVGTWVPNSVISWLGVVLQAPILLKNNGTPNSSQVILNLESTDSSIGITDLGAGNIDFQLHGGGGVVFDTPGEGGFFSAGMKMQDALLFEVTTGPIACTAIGQVLAWQFTLEASYTISFVAGAIYTGISGQTCNFGIYDADLNLMIDSGPLSAASSVVISTPITSVTLPPGTYWFAASCTSASVFFETFNSTITPAKLMLAQGTTPRVAYSSESMGAGPSLPATLGTLTSQISNLNSIPCVFFGV
jgi:hypothetical protein